MDQIQEIETFIEDRWSSASLNSEEDCSEMTFFSIFLFFSQVCFIYLFIISFCYLMTPLYTAYTPLYANI